MKLDVGGAGEREGVVRYASYTAQLFLDEEGKNEEK